MLSLEGQVPIGDIMKIIELNYRGTTPGGIMHYFPPPFPEEGIVKFF